MPASWPWPRALWEVTKRPEVLIRRLRILRMNKGLNQCRAQWLSSLAGSGRAQVLKYIREIHSDRKFICFLRKTYGENVFYHPFPTDFMTDPSGSTLFFHCVSLYVLVRICRFSTIVETGGTPGKSSAFILRAIEQNGMGRLYTIDLPSPVACAMAPPAKLKSEEVHSTRLRGLREPGWLVPPPLRKWQERVLGNSKDLLHPLLCKLGKIDLFVHDSDHAYDHVTFELETALPFLSNGGFLWVDDIASSSAWDDLCLRHDLMPANFTSQGVVRKSHFQYRG